MSQIAAAENTVINMLPGRWQIVTNTTEDPQVLLEVTPEDALRYIPTFGTTRRLPTSGKLSHEDIHQITLGWSQEEESWHLGLILSSELTATRGSRWCELARWPDPDQTVFLDHATAAGKSLAAVLNKPFNFVEPAAPEEIAPEPPPLPALPLEFGVWSVSHSDAQGNHSGDKLMIVRSPAWLRNRYTRIFWYVVWTLAYVILSVATITSEIALPNAGTLLPDPHLLPYLGLVTAGVLVVMIFRRIYEINTQPDTFVIDPAARDISAWHGDTEKWRIGADDIQSVYITEVVKRNSDNPALEHGEINLHLGGGKFQFVLHLEESEAHPHSRLDEKPKRSADVVLPLTAETVDTDLQAAGLHIAARLGDIPCWYDVRVKFWFA